METPVASPENQIEEEKPKTKKKEPVTTESVALSKGATEFIKALRSASTVSSAMIDKEMKEIEPGHPHYSDLKFAKIRVNRTLNAAEELHRGKGIR